MILMKRIFLICVVLLTIYSVPTFSFAERISFETNKMSANEKNLIKDNVEIISIQGFTPGSNIRNFDINSDGEMLLLMVNDEIVVLNSSGNYLYGFQFNNSGTAYVEWGINGIWLYTVRGGIAINIDIHGNVIDLKSISSVYENREKWDFLKNTEIEIGDTKYILRNSNGFLLNFFTDGYSELVAVDSMGEIEIYNYGTDNFARILLVLILVIVFSIISITYLIKGIKRIMKGNNVGVKLCPEDTVAKKGDDETGN